MVKAAKKKSAKKVSNIFHNIMQASVKGNPKPEQKKKIKKGDLIKAIDEANAFAEQLEGNKQSSTTIAV